MEGAPGAGDGNRDGDRDEDRERDRERERQRIQYYGIVLFNLFFGRLANYIVTRIRNVLQANRRRFIRKRWGIRWPGSQKPVNQRNQKTRTPDQLEAGSSIPEDESDDADTTTALVYQSATSPEDSEPIAGPSGIQKSSLNLETEVTEPESKEKTEETIARDEAESNPSDSSSSTSSTPTIFEEQVEINASPSRVVVPPLIGIGDGGAGDHEVPVRHVRFDPFVEVISITPNTSQESCATVSEEHEPEDSEMQNNGTAEGTDTDDTSDSD
ncbi:hypothetical protein Trydic_g6986 [Trypoxylus dichotomus]